MERDGTLVLLVGAPAAGKSTFAELLVAQGLVAAEDVLSSDAIGRELGDDATRGNGDTVFHELRAQLELRLTEGRPTVVDATQLWPRRRAQHVRLARSYDRRVVAVVFHVPAEELLRRNAAREDPVPPGAIVLMSRQAATVDEATLRDEGVAEVTTVVDAHDVDEAVRFVAASRGSNLSIR